jgi:hypothetical protein
MRLLDEYPLLGLPTGSELFVVFVLECLLVLLCGFARMGVTLLFGSLLSFVVGVCGRIVYGHLALLL